MKESLTVMLRSAMAAFAQNARAPLAPLPAPLAVRKPGPATDADREAELAAPAAVLFGDFGSHALRPQPDASADSA